MSSAPAGWYDDGSGRKRWWDGLAWTDVYEDQQQPIEAPVAEASQSKPQSLSNRMKKKHDLGQDEDAIWSAVGRPLSGLGAGRYKLTTEYLIFETGTLSSKGQQIRTREIYDVDSSQSMTQKARDVGSITLWARRESGNERVVLQDIPNFREGVNLINRVSDEARIAQHLRENTSRSTVEYSGLAQTLAASVIPTATSLAEAAPSQAAGLDINAELERLAAFRDQGILDEEEFTAAKRKMLGL
ncbi:DUF2510 domain-containing protein [Leucobacter viscericola]|uniref:DUF2510 domain-containing protein n=1 Tax=Leucobacter viscericola TaxID=2714935 RepID=A0A6G7XF77_9MICO|nr:PH domain-containing protein [Leucobacter viscericola]QIK63215.1 DUF2510 domain-containing protein [Leucobacter viscericola]